jgi:DNA-binding XRE family transcriptional regulator
METINYVTLSELEDKYIDKRGNPKREEYELILSMDILGEKIKQLRKGKNLTQEQLGKFVGVQKVQISKLENGKNNSILGMFKGMFEITDDFDEPLEEFSEYMYLGDNKN